MDDAELRRLARKTGFDVAMLEKDYALTWLLSGIYSDDSRLRTVLIFKGGTAIRKVYFPEWRLSEDLDFTIADVTSADDVKQDFEEVFAWLRSRSNIAYSFGSFRAGQQGIMADVQFVGPLRFKNKIAHDISLVERLADKPVWKSITPEYGDIPTFEIQVYSLNEILVEKIRSIIQRGRLGTIMTLGG